MSALSSIKKYGVQPSLIHHISSNNFRISDTFADCFYLYQLKYWEAKYFLSQVSEGTIKSGGKEFVVIYHNTTRGKILAAAPDTQLALSFRAAQEDFGILPCVLVSLPAPRNS